MNTPSKKSRLALGLTLTSLSASFAIAQTGPANPLAVMPKSIAPANAIHLSLKDALSRGLKASLDLKAAMNSAQAALYALRATQAIAGPSISVGTLYGSTTSDLDHGTVLSYTTPIGPKLSAQISSGHAGLDLARALLLQNHFTTEMSVQTGYFEALQAQNAYALAQKQVEDAQRVVDANSQRLKSGDVAEGDLLRTRIQLRRAQAAATIAKTAQQAALDQLRGLLFIPPDTPLVLDYTLAQPQPIAKKEALVAEAMAKNPDIAAANANAEAANAQYKSARYAWFPDLFISAQHYDNSFLHNENSLRVGLTFTLPSSAMSYDIASARSKAQAARQSYEATVHRVTSNIEAAYDSFLGAQKSLSAFDAQRLADDKKLLDMDRFGYERGAVSYLQLLDAESVYYQEQLDYGNALVNVELARTNLELATGASF